MDEPPIIYAAEAPNYHSALPGREKRDLAIASLCEAEQLGICRYSYQVSDVTEIDGGADCTPATSQETQFNSTIIINRASQVLNEGSYRKNNQLLRPRSPKLSIQHRLTPGRKGRASRESQTLNAATYDAYLEKLIAIAGNNQCIVARLIGEVDMLERRLRKLEQLREQPFVNNKTPIPRHVAVRALELDLSLPFNPRSVLHDR